jgi:hypothetical protein
VVGVGTALVVPGMITSGPQPITEVPADDPARGLVYAGLSPARKGDPCVGSYQVAERGQCSHGPDAPPAGLNVRDVAAPVAPATEPAKLPQRDTSAPRDLDLISDEGGFTVEGGLSVIPDGAAASEPGAVAADAGAGTAAVTVGPNGIACDGDGVSGKRIQVLYVRDANTASRFAQYLQSFRTWAAGVNTIYDASAKETGGSRLVRYVTTPDCQVDVQEVEVPAGAMGTFNANITALRNLGFNRTDRKYMIFGDSQVYCGIGTFAGDERAGATNRSNAGPSYGRSDTGCWTASVAAHELGHNLGAVNNSAPNSSKAGHCIDEYDVMCYNDGNSAGLRTSVKCSDRAHDQRLDCNHDDYYHTNPSAGSYLATRWNVADNQFLINNGGGGGPTPTPTATTPGPTPTTPRPTATTPRPTPTTPRPTPTATTPAPTPTTPRPTATTPGPTPTTPVPTPTGGMKELRVSDTTATSTRLAWDATGTNTRYGIVLNGRAIGQVRSTRVRIVGMRPDTEYRIGVTVGGTAYTNTATVRTLAAVPPAAGAWLALVNSQNNYVADVFGARSAPDTPVIAYRSHGGANQVWRLEAAGTGSFLIRSKASNLCLAPVGGRDIDGTPLVQQACDPTNLAQQWKLTSTPFGTALTSGAGLAIGVGGSRYHGSRLLVLQRSTGARLQSWTARTA